MDTTHNALDATTPSTASASSDREDINICMACDNAYLPYCAAAIASIWAHRSAGRRYRIFLLSQEVTPALLEPVASAYPENELCIELVNPAHKLADLMQLPMPAWYTHAALFRLAMPQLLEVQRVVYLDSDLVVLRDVADLYHADLHGNAIGGVLDQGLAAVALGAANDVAVNNANLINADNADSNARSGNIAHTDHSMSKTIGDKTPKASNSDLINEQINKRIDERIKQLFPETLPTTLVDYRSYINSGVMVCDLTQFERFCTIEQALAFLTEHHPPFIDQDVINHFFAGHIALLDMRWNVQFDSEGKRSNIMKQYGDAAFTAQYQAAHANPWIFHYAGPVKPWHEHVDGSQYFWPIARQSSLYEDAVRDYVMTHARQELRDALTHENEERQLAVRTLWQDIERIHQRGDAAQEWETSLQREAGAAQEQIAELGRRMQQLQEQMAWLKTHPWLRRAAKAADALSALMQRIKRLAPMQALQHLHHEQHEQHEQ